MKHEIVFLFDVDNTLLDNDRVTHDLRAHLARQFGDDAAARYFAIFEALRAELGYADYLGALQRFRLEHPRDVHLLRMSMWLVDYPFANRLFPASLDAIAHVQAWGPAVILSDGDVVFQPRKIERSGLWEAVDGRVLIYLHKERELADVARRYPADHYVLIDDKVRILSAAKDVWGEQVTTVFPRQGHYALDAATVAQFPRPDLTIERISDLLDYDRAALVGAGRRGGDPTDDRTEAR
jgi:FMN phosphatase YigB (HAD superfamily)